MSEGYRTKLSLVAQFDDISRIIEQLCAGNEDEFIASVEAQETYRQRFLVAERDIERKDHEILKLKREKDIFDTKLKHAKSLIETEMHKRIKIEQEKRSLERQIALIKEVLLTDQTVLNDNAKEKLAFLSSHTYKNAIDVSPRPLATVEESIGSILSPSDVSFDKTDDLDDEDTEVVMTQSRSKRVRSSSKRLYPKKPKLHVEFSTDEQECGTVSESESFEHAIINGGVNKSRKTRSKYPSEPAPIRDVFLPTFQTSKSESDPVERNNVSFKDIPETPDRISTGSAPLRRFSSTGKMNRNHVFVSKMLIRPEKCYPCGDKIHYFKQALKCQDCRVTCHSECRDKVVLPCYPSTHTPTSTKGAMGIISDYTPTTPPMIPSILIHCVNEIESRGLDEAGLYRVPGSEREVRDLKEKFLKGKGVPCLNKNDIHAVCGTVKEFLRSLREPLITRHLWKDFVCAAEMRTVKDEFGPMYEVINLLPHPNRDTLAFLILHLHCIAKSPKCLMPIENLSKVFAPTVIGYSEADTADIDMLSETNSQNQVMKMLLDIPANFWSNYIFHDNVFKSVSDTPEIIPVTDGNRLGPITRTGTTSYKSRGVVLAKTPLTPRNQHLGPTRQRKPFFASPLLK